MYLYVFLSVIVICITFIICFVLSNLTEISDYREYKNDHFELQTFKKEYNEKIESICKVIENIKACDIEFVKNDNKLVRILFSIKNVLHDNDIDAYKKLEAIDHVINDFLV